MAIDPKLFGATKSESSLLVLFIPSADRDGKKVRGHDKWVKRALKLLGTLHGGATAFPQGRGVWRDDARAGNLVFDEPTVIQCYTNEESLQTHAKALREFLVKMGEATKQGAVGWVIDRDYLEIRF